jgi:transposase
VTGLGPPWVEALEGKARIDEHKKFLKAQRMLARAKHPKVPGQKAGHPGFTRRKPRTIDHVIEQTLRSCPDCHHLLSESQEVTEHIQEDLIPAHVEVTLYLKHRYWCRHCECMVSAPYHGEEIPNSYLGPNVLIQTVILKYHHGLPFNKIRELFKDLCSLEVSEGALAQSLQRLGEWLSVEVSDILKAIRASPLIHRDETGWNIRGTNHWLWNAVNEKLAYYRIDRSRGAKVAREILGKNFPGTLVTDFYAAYNRLGFQAQKCLVHLKRTMKEYAQKDSSPEFLKYHKRLRRILLDASKLEETRPELSREVFKRRLRRLKQRLFLWSCGEYENKHLKLLAKRFLKHWRSLLTFLEKRGVPSHNNLAERMIRPHVIIRNRSYLNRSEKGALARISHQMSKKKAFLLV